VKLAILYNYKVLVEYSKIAIISYFKDVGAEKYLKERPDLRKELGPSKAKNEYGQRMTSDVKVLGTKLLKSEVSNNSNNIWFKEVLLDLINFGDGNTDIAMAYLLILLYKLELFEDIVEEDGFDDYDSGENIYDSMVYYDVDIYGNVTLKTYGGEEYDELQQFNPDIHLSDYDKYLLKQKREKEKKEREEAMKSFEKKKNSMFEDLVKEEILRTLHNTK
jgi:hypothetical protein